MHFWSSKVHHSAEEIKMVTPQDRGSLSTVICVAPQDYFEDEKRPNVRADDTIWLGATGLAWR